MTKVFHIFDLSIFQRAFGMALSSLRSRGRGKVPSHGGCGGSGVRGKGEGGGGGNVSSSNCFIQPFINLLRLVVSRVHTSLTLPPFVIVSLCSLCLFVISLYFFVIFSCYFSLSTHESHPAERCSIFPEEPGLRQVQHLSLKSALGEQTIILNNS